jgi:DNA-binding response OmpR family regulator
VTVAGAPVSLTPREFALLEALARRSPDVVTKADLLDDVWGADRDVDPNAVEVYIGYLRRKVDAPFGRTAIQTVRGLGYRLVPA